MSAKRRYFDDFDPLDLVRLEVEVPPTGLTNLVVNTDGKLGAWGWITPVAGSFMEGAPTVTNGLKFTAPVTSTPSWFTTEPMPITAGQYAAAAWQLVAISGHVRVRFEWLDAAYGLLSSSTQSGYLLALGAAAYAPQQAPASTAFVRLRFDHYSDTAGAAPAGSAQVTLTNVKVAKAATSAALGSGRTNLVANPSFETNTANWSVYGGASLTRSTAQAASGTASGVITATSGAPVRTISTRVSVSGGRDYTFQWKTRAATTARTVYGYVQWLAADGSLVAQRGLAGGPNSTSSWTRRALTFTAPTEAAFADLFIVVVAPTTGEVHYVDAVMVSEGVDVPAYFDGSMVASGTITYAWVGSSHASASTLTDTTLGSLVPTVWRNIMGPTYEIKCERESLNLGTLNASIADASLDPSQTSTLRPGRRVRLLELAGGVWEPIFTGKTTRLDVTYDEKRLPVRPPSIVLAAVDATQPLAAARRPDGVQRIVELPYVLEGAGVPWKVNGSGNQVPTATVVASNDNATALDQIAITRDTALGYAFVDRSGVLVANDYVPSQNFPNGTFNTNAGGWAAMFGASIGRVTTPVYEGAGALRITSSTGGASGAASATGTAGVPVMGGGTYRLTAAFRAATTGRPVNPLVRWYNAAGAFVYGKSSLGVADKATDWTVWTETFVAPPNAAYMSVDMTINGSANGEIHYLDYVSVALVTTERLADGSVYSDLDLSFSSEGCINSVNVKYLRPNADGSTEEVAFGPYEDAASIEQWGRRAAEFTVQGIGESNVPAYAAKILARNATPVVQVNSITVPIREQSQIGRGLWDLGDLCRVTYPDKAIDQTLRISNVSHALTPAGWHMELGFEAPSSVASPQPTPPVQSTGTSGWVDLPFQNGWAHWDPAGASWEKAQYRIRDGEVHLRGLLNGQNAAAGSVIAQLPTGYRPTAPTAHFAVASPNGTTGTTYITVGADGRIVHDTTSAAKGVWVSLRPVSWLTD